MKYVKRLYAISSAADHCVIASNQEEEEDQYTLSLCNALGTTVDMKQLTLEPLFLCMSSSNVFAASRDVFFAWHFRTAQTWTVETGRTNKTQRKEQTYHVDDNPTGLGTPAESMQNMTSTQDPICCIAASEKILVVGRESGMLQRYTLPTVALAGRYNINTKPYKININCNSS